MLRRLMRPSSGRRVPLPILWLIGVAGVVVGAVLARGRRGPREDWTTDWTRTAPEAWEEADVPAAAAPEVETAPEVEAPPAPESRPSPILADDITPTEDGAATIALETTMPASAPGVAPPVALPVRTVLEPSLEPPTVAPSSAEPRNWISDRTSVPDASPEAAGISRLGILLLLTIVLVSIALVFYYVAVR